MLKLLYPGFAYVALVMRWRGSLWDGALWVAVLVVVGAQLVLAVGCWPPPVKRSDNSAALQVPIYRPRAPILALSVAVYLLSAGG